MQLKVGVKKCLIGWGGKVADGWVLERLCRGSILCQGSLDGKGWVQRIGGWVHAS